MTIPFIEFGDVGPSLHIAHANAYTAGSYRQLGQQLATQYRVLAMQQRPTWPHSDPAKLERWVDLVPDLTVPMLLIYAEHSDVLNDQLVARVKSLQPAVETVKVPDSSHLLPFEKPAEVAQIILDWLR